MNGRFLCFAPMRLPFTSKIVEHSRYLLHVDIDTLRWGYFPLSSDRFQIELAMKNLKALWSNFQQAGACRLIISDVIEERKHLQCYRQAVPGAQMIVVRLQASFRELERRLKNREVESGLDRNLERTAELARKLEQVGIEDIVINTDGKSVTAVAWEILQRCGWRDVTSPPSST